jgi:hypothetical protein
MELVVFMLEWNKAVANANIKDAEVRRDRSRATPAGVSSVLVWWLRGIEVSVSRL